MVKSHKCPQLVRAKTIKAREKAGAHPWNASSELHGTPIGTLAGLERTGVNLVRIPPDKESFAYHSHHLEEEWIYILSGRAIAEIDALEYEVGAGDFMGFPTPSVAHHLRNCGTEDLVYLMGGESLDFEVADFPKQGKRIIRSGGKVEVFDLGAAQTMSEATTELTKLRRGKKSR
jgi:uncharacterized cupin superfamily protein